MAPAQLDVMVAGWRCVQRRWRMPTVDNTAACSRRSDPPYLFRADEPSHSSFQFPVSSFQFPPPKHNLISTKSQFPVSSFQFPVSRACSHASLMHYPIHTFGKLREPSRRWRSTEVQKGLFPVSRIAGSQASGGMIFQSTNFHFPDSQLWSRRSGTCISSFQFPESQVGD